MKMPKSVKIGSQVWEITEQKRKHNSDFQEGTYGFTMDKNNTIVIDIEMADSIKRVTLFHELLHAVRFTYGGSFIPHKSTLFTEWEHFFIGLYEEPVICMLRDNPELVEYLISES